MMIDATMLFLFLGGALLLNITPGPDMAFTLATSAKGGTRAGLAATVGICTASLIWAMLTAGGLAALLAASEHTLSLIRLAGGIYLIYLGLKTYAHRAEFPDSGPAANIGQAFRSGVLTNMLNPKVGLFYLAFLPTFVDPARGAVWLQILILGALFTLSGGLTLAVVAVAGGKARDHFVNSVTLRTRLNCVVASVFGGLGLYLVFSQTKEV